MATLSTSFLKHVLSPILISIACIGSAFGQALPLPKLPVTVEVKPDKAMIVTMETALKKARPNIEIESVAQSPLPNVYVVKIKNGPSIFTNINGSLVFTGEMLVLKDGVYSRWEDPATTKNRLQMRDKIKVNDTIVFPAKGATKATVYVFTDVDCGYCRKLHSQISSFLENGKISPGFSDLGIEIRYLAFPRTGLNTESGKKIISAWCAKDRQNALTKLKKGEEIPNLICVNPVAQQFELGSAIGVNGTPAIWLPNGDLHPGYVSPSELAKLLNIK